MTEAFIGTAILTMFLAGLFAGGVGMSLDIESRRLALVSGALSALMGLATVACWLGAIWWEVLAR